MNYSQPPNKQHFYEQVWTLTRNIPCGQVATYGQIAKMLTIPDGISVDDYKMYGARWVGMAMGACPDDVPWQRVVNSQGRISHQTQRGLQKQLLESEGVLFMNEKLNLKQYQWHGSDKTDRQTELF